MTDLMTDSHRLLATARSMAVGSALYAAVALQPDSDARRSLA